MSGETVLSLNRMHEIATMYATYRVREIDLAHTDKEGGTANEVAVELAKDFEVPLSVTRQFIDSVSNVNPEKGRVDIRRINKFAVMYAKAHISEEIRSGDMVLVDIACDLESRFTLSFDESLMFVRGLLETH
ncbi:MAG: hypothetical protein AAB552_04040 [Patescibacteria group bacterium]